MRRAASITPDARADVHELILKGEEKIGPEVDDLNARNIALEAADVRVGSKQVNGKLLEELSRTSGFGLQLKALFRQGQVWITNKFLNNKLFLFSKTIIRHTGEFEQLQQKRKGGPVTRMPVTPLKSCS